MAKLNAEVDTTTSAHYRARVYPTVMLLTKDGAEIDRLVGYARAPEFMKQVDDYLAGKNTLASLEAEAAAKGSDPEFAARLAEKYYYHGLFDQAKTQYEKLIDLDPKNQSGQVDDALYTLARMSRKNKDYAGDRMYAQQIVDRFPESDMFRPALLEIAGAWRREGDLTKARRLYLDYAKRFPDDEDTPWAREQADTLAVRIAADGKGA
ncbi:MAG TPA: tetratricopeptide repeat protein [Candidatus Eisenbacteria bacterium]|nr:tetratricopeptide repeat protein [Candidatus Eisenbacteria bacterium]